VAAPEKITGQPRQAQHCPARGAGQEPAPYRSGLI